MSAAERGECDKHGVHRIAEIAFGWTALVAVTAPDGPPLAPTRADLIRAFSGNAARWSDIDLRLPALGVASHGLAAEAGQDGGVAHGSDAGLVVSAVARTPGAVGLLPYAQAMTASQPLRLLAIEGVSPTPAAIAAGRYPLVLPLILMVKTGEAATVPGMPALLAAFAASIDPGGPFVRRGLVPLAAPARADARHRIAAAARL